MPVAVTVPHWWDLTGAESGAELRAAGRGLPGPRPARLGSAVEKDLVGDVERALYASKIVAYAQGFNQIQAGSADCDWRIDPAKMATIWRGAAGALSGPASSTGSGRRTTPTATCPRCWSTTTSGRRCGTDRTPGGG